MKGDTLILLAILAALYMVANKPRCCGGCTPSQMQVRDTGRTLQCSGGAAAFGQTKAYGCSPEHAKAYGYSKQKLYGEERSYGCGLCGSDKPHGMADKAYGGCSDKPQGMMDKAYGGCSDKPQGMMDKAYGGCTGNKP